MKKTFIEQVILYDYRYPIGYLLLFGVALYSLFWRLGTLLPGLSSYEAEYLNGFGQTLSSVSANPLYWPHKLLTQASSEWLGSTELAFRLPTALLALVGLIVFFFIIRHRFRARVAMVGVLLLSTANWWLASARLARPEIMIPVMMLMIALLARLTLETHRGVWLVLLGVAVGVSFYVPLMPYIIIIASVVSYSVIRKTAAEFSREWRIAFYSILIASLVPLLIAIVNDLSIGKQLLAIPADWPSFSQYFSNLNEIVASVFWSADEFTPLNLGTLPYLDVFTVAMVVLGFYYLDHEISRSLTQFLTFGILALLLVLSFNPLPGNTIILIPFVYTLVAAGIVMLFSQWYEIFPRNPIARMAVFLPTIALLGAVVWYHHTRYFIAAPRSPQIVETFPPLSSAIGEFIEIVPAGKETIILTTDSQTAIAEAAARTYLEAQITSVPSAAIGQPNLAVTNEALEQLDAEDRALAEKTGLTALNSPYSSIPVVIWYTTNN